MGTIKIFGQALRTTARKARLLAFLWVIYSVFALAVVAPFYFLLQSQFSRSLLGDRLLAGADLLWIGDLVYRYQEIPPLIMGWLLGTALLFLVLSTFLNGGVIGRIADSDGKLTFAVFFGDCGRHFGRFFRVLLLSLVGYVLVFAVLGRFVSLPFRAWSKGASSEWTTLTSSSLRLLVFLLLFSIVKMFFDYVKVRLVVEDSRKAVRAMLRNFRFLGRRFFGAWALFLVTGLVLVLFTLAYLLVAKTIPKTGAGPLLLFLWQQAYFLAKLWTEVLFFATEYHFLKAQQPEG
jgi:hypothetical protein